MSTRPGGWDRRNDRTQILDEVDGFRTKPYHPVGAARMLMPQETFSPFLFPGTTKKMKCSGGRCRRAFGIL